MGRALPAQISRRWRPLPVLGHMAFPPSHPDPECRGKVRALVSLQEKKPKPHRSPRIPPAGLTHLAEPPLSLPKPSVLGILPGLSQPPCYRPASVPTLRHRGGGCRGCSPPSSLPGAPAAQGAAGGGRQPRSQPPRGKGAEYGAWGASAPGSTLPVPAKALRQPGAELAPARTPPRPPWPWAAACGPGPGMRRSAEALHAASTSQAMSLGHVALGRLEGRILATSFSGGSAAVMINPCCVNRSVLQPFSSQFPALENAPLPTTSHARGPIPTVAQGKSPRAGQAGAGDLGSGHGSGQDLARPWLLGPSPF